MTMGFANAEQLRDLFLCGGMGFLLGLYYDGFRLLRLWCFAPWAIFVQDCVYCISSAAAVFLFSLAVTDGRLRLFLFVGLVAGFFAYRHTVGRVILRSAVRFRRLCMRAYGFCRSMVASLFERLKKVQKNEKKA